MAGLLGSLHSAKTGMSVSQVAIQTTSHNINNMNTPGYSRQRVEQSARSAYCYPGYNSKLGAGQIGTGVEATDVTRIRNTFYDYQYRSESHGYGKTSVEYDYYKNMESVFNEPSDNAISSSLNNFFNGWSELSKDPDNIGAKSLVIENAKYLANNINRVHEKLEGLQMTLNKQQENTIDDVNNMLSRLEELDKNIKIVEASGQTPNDLLDEKDKILDELSFKLDINQNDVQQALSSKDVNTGEYLTIDELRQLTNPSGELGGILKMNEKLDVYKNDIVVLANGIANSVNDIYNEGRDPNLPRVDFYEVEVDNQGNFVKFKLNDNIESNPERLEMTSEKALKLYKLKDEKITIVLGEEPVSIKNFYNSIVQKLGQESQTVIRNEKNQSKLLSSIDNSRLSVSGVSLDEEMVNLIQFQHAYNASAKVISTLDSLLDVVVNGLVR